MTPPEPSPPARTLPPPATSTRRAPPPPRDERLVRFSRAEIAFHWAFVPPYLVLGLTGLGLLAEQNLGAAVLARATLLRAHLAAGAALAILPALVLMASRPEPFRRLLAAALRWTWKDLAWLATSMARLLVPRTPLPGAGRFNAGQKLNLLHVVLLVPFLAATGFLIWAGGGAFLVLRVLHAAAAFVSLALAAGHLYLALVHPPTRRALGSIFHGRIAADYAAGHHALWYEEVTGAPAPRAAEPPRGRRRHLPIAGIAALALAAGLAAALAALPRLRAGFTAAARRYLAEPRRLVEPAALHPLHRDQKELATCGGCHTAAGPVPDARCLACHEEVAKRARISEGFHGRMGQDCAGCHADHGERLIRLEDRDFNHDLALFRLEGAHRNLACERCHEEPAGARRRYLWLPAAGCADCHRDLHRPSLGTDCRHCHEQGSWEETAPSFDHERDAAFPLAGLHRTAACQDCHPRPAGPGAAPPVLRGTTRECSGCHADPHGGLAARCADCHAGAASWSAELFSHARARFPLDPRHRTLACAGCHAGEEALRFRRGSWAAGSEHQGFPCESCHADAAQALSGKLPSGEVGKPSPHLGKVACADCHRLEPEVRTEPCAGCHPRDYDGLAIDWRARLDLELARLPASAAASAASWRLAGAHHWESAVTALRAGPAQGEVPGSSSR